MKQDSETEMLKEYSEQEYKYGFVSDIESETLPPGLNEETIIFISKKNLSSEYSDLSNIHHLNLCKAMPLGGFLGDQAEASKTC